MAVSRRTTFKGPRTCVFCRRQPVEASWAPFCSERCRLQDLARWVDGSYRIAGEKVGERDSEAPDNDNDDSRDTE